MEIVGIILLILIGMTAVVLEIIVIPGFIVGLIGLCMIIGGIIASYVLLGTLGGNITLISTTILILIVLFFALRSKTWKRLTLDTVINSKVNTIDANLKVGDEGISISRLAPTGKAKFAVGDFEVHSINDFIDVNQKVEIIKIEGYKIIVKLKN